MSSRILLVDDVPSANLLLRAILERDGHQVQTATGGRQALELLHAEPFQLAITDLMMPEFSGHDLLVAIRDENLPLGVIVLTGEGDTSAAVEVMRVGADEFVTKPFDPERMRYLVRRILDRRRLMDEQAYLQQRMHVHSSFHNMISKSPKMRRVFDLIQRYGPSPSTVLIHGETGTGKELAAEALHKASGRSGLFWPVNCAALPANLLESELFGHEKGAFTGADRRKLGRFETAKGGTLFLDEIGELPLGVQAKLLRVLQDGRFERVGGVDTIQSDVRIIAATNRRLEDEAAAGRFRRDLFYRLNVMRVELPPLRDRQEDIPLLAMHFLKECWRRRGDGEVAPRIVEIDPEAMHALLAHPWSGNVRELEHAINRAVMVCDGAVIRRDHLPPDIAPAAQRGASSSAESLIDIERPLHEVTNDLIARVEREYFQRLLVQFQGNIAKCSLHSGLSRRSVAQKLQKLGLDRQDFKGGGQGSVAVLG